MATRAEDFLKANPKYVGRANTANQTPAKPTGRGGFFSSLISEGGAAGGAALGIPFGPLGMLIGAGIGGFGGRLAENKVRDDRFDSSSLKQAALEGGLASALSGLGPLYKGAKGAYAARGAIQAAPTLARGATRKSAASIASKLPPGANLFTPNQALGLTDQQFMSGSKEFAGLTRKAITQNYGKPATRATQKVAQAVTTEAMDLAKAAKLTAGPNKLVRGGREAVRATLGIDDILAPGKVGPTSILKADDMLDEALKSGFKGSPKTIQRQIAVQYGRFNKSVAQELAKSTKATSTTQLFKNAQKEIAEKLPISIDGVPVRQELSRSLSQLKALSSNGKINASAINQFKNSLDVDSAFKKVSGELSSSLTAKETADLALWKQADSWITKLAPSAKELTKRQSNLYGLSKGLARMTRSVGEPNNLAQIAVRGLQRPFRATENAVGRAMIKTGGAEAGVGNLVPQAARGFTRSMAGQAVRQSPANLIEALTSARPTPEQDTTLYGAEAQQSGEIYDNQTPSLPNGTSGPLDPRTKQPIQQSAYSLERALADIQANPDAKSRKNIMDYYDFVSKAEASQAKAGGGGKLNVTKPTQEDYTNAQTGTEALQMLNSLIQSDPRVLQRTRVPGRGLNILGIGSEIQKRTGTSEFDTLGFQAVENLLRIQTGAAAPETEVRRYMNKYLPQPSDNEQARNLKLQRMNAFFSSVLKQAQGGETEAPYYGQVGY